MEDYREIILDRRTKIIKDDNHIFIVYKMMRKIPYRSCIGTMRYRWVEVSRVYSDTVMENMICIEGLILILLMEMFWLGS